MYVMKEPVTRQTDRFFLKALDSSAVVMKLGPTHLA